MKVINIKSRTIFAKDVDSTYTLYKVQYKKDGSILMVSVLNGYSKGFTWVNIERIGSDSECTYYKTLSECLEKSVEYSDAEIHCFKDRNDCLNFLIEILTLKHNQNLRQNTKNNNKAHGF
jgi:hypothetical protein